MSHTESAPDAAATPPAGPPIVATLSPDADHGPQPGAEGTVILDGTGDPITYVVAAGDNLSSIAPRFGISLDDLTTRAEIYTPIYPGEELDLVE